MFALKRKGVEFRFQPDLTNARGKTAIKGRVMESAVMNWLDDQFDGVEKSTRDENIKKDIDCYVKDYAGVRRSVSIKCEERTEQTGNLCFELEVFNRFYQRHSLEQKWVGRWESSTFYKPKDAYIVAASNKVYLIDTDDLSEFIERFGWCSKTQLSQFIVRQQIKEGHSHINANLGLLSLSKLVNSGVAQTLGELRPQDWVSEEYLPILSESAKPSSTKPSIPVKVSA